MNTAPVLERSDFAVSLMNLEKTKNHKWRRNSQGLIQLVRSPNGEHGVDCLGPTCVRCGRWFCMRCDGAEVDECPPRALLI